MAVYLQENEVGITICEYIFFSERVAQREAMVYRRDSQTFTFTCHAGKG